MKHVFIYDCDLDNHIQSKGYNPKHTNGKKSIYEYSEEVHKVIIGWCKDNDKHGKYNKGFHMLETDREYQTELRFMEG